MAEPVLLMIFHMKDEQRSYTQDLLISSCNFESPRVNFVVKWLTHSLFKERIPPIFKEAQRGNPGLAPGSASDVKSKRLAAYGSDSRGSK